MNMQPVGEGMPTTTAAPVSAERARVLSSDDKAKRRAQFESEALTHLDALYSFALKLTHERDEAEDLVSETMLRAFDRWEQYQLGTNVRAWLFTIATNLGRNHFRSQSRRRRAYEAVALEPAPGAADRADGHALAVSPFTRDMNHAPSSVATMNRASRAVSASSLSRGRASHSTASI